MIRKYLQEYGVWYLLYGLMMGFFLLTFWLYHLPLVFFVNSLALNLLILLGITVWLFLRFRRKLLDLASYTANLDLQENYLPSDQAYLSIIADLEVKVADSQSQATSQIKRLEALVKMWSHQMKIPISALSLMAQTDNLDKQEVKQQLLRLQNYLTTLLAYFKFSQHQDDFRFELVSARAVAVDLVKAYRVSCLAKGLSVQIEGDWQVKTDKKWLTFALTQILDNAIKYSKEDGTITIAMSNSGLTLADQGLGILPEDLARLFDEGFTGYNGHEHQKATGLGLFMTKQILNSLGLSIQVSSQPGQGTTVWLGKN